MTTRKNAKGTKSKNSIPTKGSLANGWRRNAGYGSIDPKIEDLAKNTEESAGEFLTSDQGLRINDNQNSLKAGNRGPSLLEDFLLRLTLFRGFVLEDDFETLMQVTRDFEPLADGG